MNLSPLNNLHKEFTIALNQSTYMGCVENQPKKLEHTSKKTIRLAEVFKLAQNEIETSLQKTPASIDQEITHLKLLQGDGKNFYARYQKSTNTWKRWFLKGLAKFTPGLLKKILPRCFSNKMKQAEQKTCQEFKQYDNLIENTIKNLSQQKNISPNNKSKPPTPNPVKPNPNKSANKDSNAKHDDSNKKDGKSGMTPHEQEIALQELLLAQLANGKNNKNVKSKIQLSQIPDLTDEEIAALYSDPANNKSPVNPNEGNDKANKKIAAHTLDNIQQAFENLQNFSKHPLTLPKFKKDLLTICQGIKTLAKIDSMGQEALKKFGLDDKHHITFTHPELLQKLVKDTNDAEILELLKDTDWHANFEEAMKQTGFLKFGYNKLLNQIVLTDENDQKVKDSTKFQNYRGKIKIIIPSIASLDELKNLIQYLEKNPTCLPNSLKISIKNDPTLTPDFVKCLLKLQEFVAEIKITGLKALDFAPKDIPQEEEISQEDEFNFVKSLHRFDFPDLEAIFLSNHPKADWTAKDFSRVLALWPKFDLLEKCFEECATYEEIIIPAELTASEKFDSQYFQIDHIDYLLSQFTHLKKLTLGKVANSETSTITEAELIKWINQPHLKDKLKALNIEGCTSLTTDILPSLAEMPQLTYSLPDLPQGKIELNKLPRSNNPFQIKMLYTQSQATQPIAASLYTGPNLWSPVFQIPLVRAGETKIFNPNQKQLGPQSVTYWLFSDDYKGIDPTANYIASVIADSNELLNDDNIVEFMQKFPKVHSLSLSNCPNVTEKGIIALLKACPNIKALDLTGNLHIKEDLLLNKGNFDVLYQMKKINLTGTGIHGSTIESFTGTNGLLTGKIKFENVNLTITDDVLFDLETFEKFLNEKKLNHLKRIDLVDCKNLTDELLSKLLDRMNEPTLLQAKDGSFQENPQRLNIAVLNLKGCSQITDEAFHQKLDEPASKDDDATAPVKKKNKIETKILETLDRVIIGKTKLTPVLSNLYPKITFQQDDTPITISMDLVAQLEACVNYHKLQEHILISGCKKKGQRSLKKLAIDYVHNRIAIELFYDKIDESDDNSADESDVDNSADKSDVDNSADESDVDNSADKSDVDNSADESDDDVSVDYSAGESNSIKGSSFTEFVRQQAIDPQAKEFCNMTLCFKPNDAADPTIFHTHRDILYYKSPYFIEGFRPGGVLNKNSDLTLINQHATPKAVQIVMDLLHEKFVKKYLNWKTAADVAELVGIEHCKLAPIYYHPLLKYIHSLFDLENADEMLLAAMKLKDKEGIMLYENALLSELTLYADDQTTFQAIANLAESHNLKKLSAEVKKIQEIKTQELINKLKNQK